MRNDQATKNSPMTRFPTFARWFVKAITRYARVRWIFSGGKDGMAAQTQQIAGAFNAALPILKRENEQLTLLVRDLRLRLEHHEAGPLRASRGEFDRQQADGIQRPKNNGRRIISLDP